MEARRPRLSFSASDSPSPCLPLTQEPSPTTSCPSSLQAPPTILETVLPLIPYPGRQTSSTSIHRRPFIIAISGPQGSGKTTLSAALKHELPSCQVISIDDLYLTRDDQLRLTRENPGNLLWRHRGQPGTHDVGLMAEVVADIKAAREHYAEIQQREEEERKGVKQRVASLVASDMEQEIRMQKELEAKITREKKCYMKLPRYDKSLNQGNGDRVVPPSAPVEVPEVLIVEGWCVGFKSLGEDEVRLRFANGEVGGALLKKLMSQEDPPREEKARLQVLESLLEVDRSLAGYDVLTNEYDFLIHIDAEDINYVYTWRLEQERAMIELRGSGMSEDEVRNFVDGYMPGYELYVNQLREGIFKERGKQIRVVLGKGWEILNVMQL
ncbi:P-loop containing nucleoside triphosphate hydrolase protein [Pyronema omphalodes]|nr:P-loop containing nucleoside triphosphate hydrolase protein [Pyronema omphalodes]